jgi:hypothetical protein
MLQNYKIFIKYKSYHHKLNRKEFFLLNPKYFELVFISENMILKSISIIKNLLLNLIYDYDFDKSFKISIKK